MSNIHTASGVRVSSGPDALRGTPTARVPLQVGPQRNLTARPQLFINSWRRAARCQSRPQTTCLAGLSAAADNSTAPLAVGGPDPADIADAARLLAAIPRSATLRELQEIAQRAQAHGCLTTAHSVATLVQLGSLAARSLGPEDTEAARRLGGDLLARLRSAPTSLSPSLAGLTEKAVTSLGLQLQSVPGQREGRSSVGNASRLQAAGAGAGAGAGPAAGPSVMPGSPGSSEGGVTGAPPASSTTQPPCRPKQQQEQPRKQPQPKQQQPRQRYADVPKQQTRTQQAGAEPGRVKKQKRQAPSQQPAGQPSTVGRPTGTSEPANSLSTTTTTTTCSSSSSIDSSSSSSSTSITATREEAPQAAAPPTAPLAPSCTEPSVGKAPTTPILTPTPTALPKPATSEVPPPAPSPPGEAPNGSLPPFSEALRLGWEAVGRRQQQPSFLLDGSAGAAAREAGPDTAARLESALQQRAPADMTLGEVAEVLQLLLELRLAPRYEWLRGARARLRGAMAEAEAEAAAGGDVQLASRLSDLQVVYDVAVGLTDMCWEADGLQREGESGDLAAQPEWQDEQHALPASKSAAVEEVAAATVPASPLTAPESSPPGGDVGVSGLPATPPRGTEAAAVNMRQAGAEAPPAGGAAVPRSVADAPQPSPPPSCSLLSSGPGEHSAEGTGTQAQQAAGSGSWDGQQAEPAHDRVRRQQEGGKGQDQTQRHQQVAAVAQHGAEDKKLEKELEQEREREIEELEQEREDAWGALQRLQAQLLLVRSPGDLSARAAQSPTTEASNAASVIRGPDPPEEAVRHDPPEEAVRHDPPEEAARYDPPEEAVRHDPPEEAVRQAIEDLSALLAEALHADAVIQSSVMVAGGVIGGSGGWLNGVSGAGAGGGEVGADGASSRQPVLTAQRLASLVGAASRLQPRLPSRLLSAAVRLLAGWAGRGGVAPGDVARVAAACATAGFVPPGPLLEQLALLSFGTANSQEVVPKQQRQGRPASVATVAAADGGDARHGRDISAVSAASAASAARSLHSCATALSHLGFRLNAKQFNAWVEAVARCPQALRPPQLAQLLATVARRGASLRAASAGALLAAALSPDDRLRQLSAADAAAVALFAAQQGLQLDDSPDEPPASVLALSAAGDAGSVGARLLSHLAPRLQELAPGELAALLPALRATGALRPRTLGPGAAAAWLDAHSAALLPQAEALLLDELLTLLRLYDMLTYRPPPLLLLGFSLCLESQLGSGRLLAVLEALHVLLCRLGFPPNEGLAMAIRDEFLPRLMVAASATAPGVVAAADETGTAAGAASGMTMAQRLRALDVLVATHVRPYPAQLAVLLEPELAGKGALGSLHGDDLVRLLWHCVAFRALPSWRFVGEWLEACAAAMRPAAEAQTRGMGQTQGQSEGAAGGRSGGGAAGAAGEEGRLSPGALVRVGWCLAQMGVQPESAWLCEYQAALRGVMPELGAEALSLAAHSVLALRTRPGEEWVEVLVRSSLARMAAADAASAARLLHFAAAAELQVSKDWMQSFFLHTLRHLAFSESEPPQPTTGPSGHPTSGIHTPSPGPGPGPRCSAASPDQVALMLRASAQLGFRPPSPWLTASLEVLRRGAATLTPACFPIALASLARVCPDVASQLGPGSALEGLVRTAHDRRDCFTAVELAWLLDTLGCHYPAYRLPGAAEANLLEALRRREALEAAGGEGAGGEQGDVAAALGDAVSGAWLAWGLGSGGWDCTAGAE